jgi:amidase
VNAPSLRDVTELSALDLAATLRRGDVTATEALEAFVARADRVDGPVHAIVVRDLARARRAAEEADGRRARGEPLGPLHGVPMTVKEVFDVEGLPMTLGLPWMRKNVPTRDATLVGRLRAAGAIVWGKTNLPMASYDWQSVNPIYGRTNNPWDLSRTPGGSSGGSAAALSARLTPLEIGSDVAGSIRVPSSFCGVVGLRPTEGLLSGAGHAHVPDAPPSVRSLVVCGPMARDVADARALLHVLAGPDGRDARCPPLPRHEGTIAPGALRLAYATQIGGLAAAEEVRTLVERFVGALREAGAHVEGRALESVLDVDAAMHTWGVIQAFEMREAAPLPVRRGPLRPLVGQAAYRAWFGVNEVSAALAEGFGASAHAYFAALGAREAIAERFDRFLAGVGEPGFDAWIAPSVPIPAFAHQRPGKALAIDDTRCSYGRAIGLYNCPTALLGTPCLALPIGRTRAGLPVGVQIVARRWTDDRLMALGEAIERVIGGGERPPIG